MCFKVHHFFVKIKDNLHIGILHVEKNKNNNIVKSLIFFGIFQLSNFWYFKKRLRKIEKDRVS